MKAALLTVGDELLIGQVVNTNAAWLGEQLSLAGVEVFTSIVLPDDRHRIREALHRASTEASLVVLTGGLGPTHDDVTREAVASFAGVRLEVDEAVLESIEARFSSRGRTMPDRNAVQAQVPEGFDVLRNPVGTAPGLWGKLEVGDRTVLLAVLPGVPHEMRYLTEHEVLPRLREAAGLRVIRHRTLLTAGIGESHLQELLGDIPEHLPPDLRLAFLPGSRGVRLRITGAGDDPETDMRNWRRVFTVVWDASSMDTTETRSKPSSAAC